jgi:hypothetical protein
MNLGELRKEIEELAAEGYGDETPVAIQDALPDRFVNVVELCGFGNFIERTTGKPVPPLVAIVADMP